MLKMSLKEKMDQYLSCIEGETQISLPKISRALKRSGLKFDNEFFDRFIRIVLNRISGTYDNLEYDTTLNVPSNGRQESKKREHNESDDEVVKQKKIRTTSASSTSVAASNVTRGNPEVIGPKRSRNGSDVSSSMGNSDLNLGSIGRNRMRTSTPKPMSNDGSMQNNDEMKQLIRGIDHHTDKKAAIVLSLHQNRFDDFDQNRSLDSGIISNDGFAKLPHALKFTCFHCSPEADSKRKCYNDIEAVHTHWIESHWNEEDVAFKFYIIECACDCFYCGVIGTCQEIFEHQTEDHANERIVIAAGNSQTCALCTYVGNQLKIHFSIEHEKPDSISLTDNVLNELLQVHIRNVDGKMFKADHSNVMIFDQIEFAICGCQSKVNPVDYFDHIKNHRHDFHCSKCQFEADSLIESVNHDKISHDMTSLNSRCLEFEDRLLKSYMDTKLVFKNGLVVAMRHLMNTKFDIHKKLKEFINGLVADQKKEYNRMNEKTREVKKNESKMNEKAPSKYILDQHELELKQLNRHYNEVFIHGIPYTKNENRKLIVLKLCKMIKANVSLKDIESVSRRHHESKILTVRFTNHTAKINVIEQKSKQTLLTNDFVKHCGFNVKVRIDWMVTSYFKNLNDRARKSMKSNLLHAYRWTKRGLFVQRTDNSKGIYVFNEEELLNYID